MTGNPGVGCAPDHGRADTGRALRRQVDAPQPMLAVDRVDLHVAQRALAGNELRRKGWDAAVHVRDRPGSVIEQGHREGLRPGTGEGIVAAA